MSNQTARIAQRFDAAASNYDAASQLQYDAAARLAQRVTALTFPSAPRVLEIGCGTGHLSRALAPCIGGSWVISDIAPAMIRICAASRLNNVHSANFLVMDAERPACANGVFDLIVSSLAAQWFSDLPKALAGLSTLLAPGGVIALATLGDSTFAEWRMAHAESGIRAATPDYPDATALRRAFPATLEVTIEEEILRVRHESPLDFVRGLRTIGADIPAAGRQPLGAGKMREVLRRVACAAPEGMSYHLLYAIATKAE